MTKHKTSIVVESHLSFCKHAKTAKVLVLANPISPRNLILLEFSHCITTSVYVLSFLLRTLKTVISVHFRHQL